MPKASILASATANFERAAALIGDEFHSDLLQKVFNPMEQIVLHLTPQMQDGQIHVFRAFVVRHSDGLGTPKGGIRMSPSVTLDDITGLAMEMTWKCALIGVPFGGGKSGIIADPETLSPADKETLIRRFAAMGHRHIGPTVYIPAPDMGTSEREMGYIKDAICYSAGSATTQGCYVTGKPVILGGIPGRREATGRGVAICAVQALQRFDILPRKATAVVQGFGNVGANAAVCLAQQGIKIIAVSEAYGAVHNSQGLDIDGLVKHVAKGNTLKSFPGGAAIDGKAMLELPCDLLVPAAAASQITSDNAPRIQARIIAEGANGPTTPEADHELLRRGIFIIPDILCNAGGVFVSYLEYTQETQQDQMTEAEVNTRLTGRMTERFVAVWELAASRKISMRDAAMYLAVHAVCQSRLARGLLV